MRGIVFALICSMFLNSTLGYHTDTMLLSNGNSASSYEIQTEDTLSENQVTVYEPYTEENVVSENDIDKSTDLSDFDINDYEIIGKTRDGNSILVEKNPTGREDIPMKELAKAEFDWDSVEIQDEVRSLSKQLYQRSGNEKTQTIYVSSEKDMLALAAMWDEGETFKGKEIIQTENIIFTRKFPGIGYGDDDAAKFGFQGTFDGNGYVFYGLKHIADRGIFPAIGRGGVVKNVTLLAEELVLKEGEVEYFNPLTEQNLGLIENYYLEADIIADKGIYIWPCAWANMGTIQNSVIKGDINAQISDIAGFALYNVAGGKILNCYNHCNIDTIYGHLGGIAGICQSVILQIDDQERDVIATPINSGMAYPRECFPSLTSEEVKSNYDEETNSTAYYMTPIIENCYNYGNISGFSLIGGIASHIASDSYSVVIKDDLGNEKYPSIHLHSNGMVVNCTNYGNIFGEGGLGGITSQHDERIVACANYGTIKGDRQVGGISGVGIDFTSGIERSANFGNIIGNYMIGGISADVAVRFCDNYNRGDVTDNKELIGDNGYRIGGLAGYKGEMINPVWGRCYSTGKVAKMSEDCNGLFGKNKEGTLPIDFYLTGDMEGIESQPGYVTKEWLKSEEALKALGSAFKKDSYGINDGYPILAWQTKKQIKYRSVL